MRWGLAAVAIVLAAIWIRVAVSAGAAFTTATEREAAGDLAGAIESCQYAMRDYSPFTSTPHEAADHLQAIADAAVARGDRATALAALRRLRGGIRATRWLLSPFADRAAAVDARLAALTAEEHAAQPYAQGRSVAELTVEHARLLALDPTPAPGWSLLVVLGFGGWVAGGFLMIFKGFDAKLKVRRGPLLRWSAVTALCLGGWVLGLVYA